MQNSVELCEPEQLKALQEIFDAVWKQLQDEGTVRAGDQAMREHLAACVLACAQDVKGGDFEAVRTAVLRFAESMGKLPGIPRLV